MNSISTGRAGKILADLIALPTVNPMGKPYHGSEPVEHKAVEYLMDIFRPYGVSMEVQSYSTLHENLIIRCPGGSNGGYTLLESHVDTVPADDWIDTAFVPKRDGHMIFGRGACDDKGPLTSMILACLAVLEGDVLPPHPVVLLAAGDEEYAQTGIKYFRRTEPPPMRSVFGEATGLTPIVQHKGTVRWDIIVPGRSAHTSQPELGRNAILGAMEVIRRIETYQSELGERFTNRLMTSPTITVTMIHGGRTRNAVPDECTIAVDFRVLPGMDPAQARLDLMAALAALGLDLIHSEPQLVTPPLSTKCSDPFSLRVLEICRQRTARREMEFAGAPYGTDASWVADCSPALVLGPGSIETAHAINENIDVRDVVKGAEIYYDILMSDC